MEDAENKTYENETSTKKEESKILIWQMLMEIGRAANL